jgi:hypothetical protein
MPNLDPSAGRRYGLRKADEPLRERQPNMWRHQIAGIHRIGSVVSRQASLDRLPVALVFSLALLGGCGNPSDPQASAREVAAQVQAVAEADPLSLDLREIAEAFALNTRATSVQRERLEQQLREAVVRWRIVVHEVMLEEGVYKIVSEPPPIRDADATALLRVVAIVHPRSDSDRQRIEALRTGDTVEVQGRAKGVLLRTVLTLQPATLRSAA